MTSQFIVRVSLAVALMGAATGAFAQQKMDKAAQTFMTKAIQGNLAEVAMGQLAQKQGESDAVRSFGQKLVADHSAANQKATSVASGTGVTPPTEPSKKHQSDAAKMAKMSGAEFDRAFARHMVADHKMEIAAHKRAAKMKNDAVAAYATESLPVLEQHLQTAESLSKASGKTGKPSM
jgi:putative membrane protein